MTAITSGLPTGDDVLLLSAIADELLAARALAEDLGIILCSDSQVVERHRIQLQDLDLLAQLLDQAARLLRVPADRASAVEDVTLAEMRGRLNAALGHYPTSAASMDDEIW